MRNLELALGPLVLAAKTLGWLIRAGLWLALGLLALLAEATNQTWNNEAFYLFVGIQKDLRRF